MVYVREGLGREASEEYLVLRDFAHKPFCVGDHRQKLLLALRVHLQMRELGTALCSPIPTDSP